MTGKRNHNNLRLDTGLVVEKCVEPTSQIAVGLITPELVMPEQHHVYGNR